MTIGRTPVLPHKLVRYSGEVLLVTAIAQPWPYPLIPERAVLRW